MKVDHIQRLLTRSRRLPLFVTVLALLVLAGTLFLTTRLLRVQLREQMAGREVEVLYTVALMHAESMAESEELAEFSSMEEPANQLLVLLKTSRLKHVIGGRLFDASGAFVESFPPNVREATLAESDLAKLHGLQPVSRFYSRLALGEIFYPDSEQQLAQARRLPLLEVNVPLYTLEDPKLVGVAQFLIEGQSLTLEFARLDRHLLELAAVVFVAAGSLLAATLGAAFRRLRKTQELLTERTRHLLQANQELVLAAKTSAVGALTAHLIHGLKNPLAGLQNFVAGLRDSGSASSDPDWQHAVAATRRMQSLINQVVQVLREQEGGQHYQITVKELVGIVAEKLQPSARQDQVQLSSKLELGSEIGLSNRTAHLVTLILLNLIENALEATPEGGTVTLTVRQTTGELLFEVADQGPGFPENLKASLFSPSPTTKEGGSGIGLAISKLLANHLSARLELQSSSAAGCVFILALPAPLFSI